MCKVATILINGKIYAEKNRFYQAMLIENGIITAVGSNSEIQSIAVENATTIDCMGKTVIPGLNDSHLHLMLYGTKKQQVQIKNANSIRELISMCREFVGKHPERTEKGLLAIGWNQDLLEDKRMPNKADLDDISTQIPIVLRRSCGHVLTANSLALKLLKRRGDFESMPSELYERDESGNLTGVIYEEAAMRAMTIVPDPSDEDREAAILDAMREAVSLGITSVQSNDISPNTGDLEQIERVIKKVFNEGGGLLRLRWQCLYREVQDFEKSLESGVFSRRDHYNRGRMLTVGPLKLFKDGSLGGRSALMRNGYADSPGTSGIEALSDETAKQLCKIAAENDIQVVTHCIGDAAIEKMVDAYETVIENGHNNLRHSILHCQITDLQMLTRIKELGILVQYQPCYLNSDLHVVDSRVGKALAETSNAYNTAYNMLGQRVSFGTDCPIESLNPFENLYCAVTRKDQKGFPEDGYYPAERMELSDALDAYTVGSAFCEFAENWKGRLKRGFCADMTVLDRDIFTIPPDEIRLVRPVMTIVDGKVVYRNQEEI